MKLKGRTRWITAGNEWIPREGCMTERQYPTTYTHGDCKRKQDT